MRPFHVSALLATRPVPTSVFELVLGEVMTSVGQVVNLTLPPEIPAKNF